MNRICGGMRRKESASLGEKVRRGEKELRGTEGKALIDFQA